MVGNISKKHLKDTCYGRGVRHVGICVRVLERLADPVCKILTASVKYRGVAEEIGRRCFFSILGTIFKSDKDEILENIFEIFTYNT